MKVHHLDVCTMCPFGGRLVTGKGSVLGFGRMVAHALVVERADGLVLVDTGIGLDDVREAARRLGRMFVTVARPRLDPEQTAARQIERLGFSRRDVRHVVVTHLDVDHAGGLPDFPEATVHLHRAEHAAATAPSTVNERHRYRPPHFAHGPRWELHDAGGDRWLGFESARAIGDDVVLVPLHGHTRGHSAVAVRAPAGAGVEWLLHCGDAYFFHAQTAAEPWCPAGLMAFQKMIAVDEDARRANVERLRELRRDAGDRVRIFSAHCPVELEAALSASRGARERTTAEGPRVS